MLQLSLEQWRQSLLLCTDLCLVYVVRLQWKKGWNHYAQTSPQLRWGGTHPTQRGLQLPKFNSESAKAPESHGGTGRLYTFPIGFHQLFMGFLLYIKLREGLAKMFHFLGGMLFFFNRKKIPRKRRIHHLNHLETHQIQPLQRNFTPKKNSSNALGRPQKCPPFVEGLLGQKSFWGEEKSQRC